MIVPPRHRFDAVLTIRQSPSERVVREAIVTRVLGKERKLIIRRNGIGSSTMTRGAPRTTGNANEFTRTGD
jgi:hypothetical protein